jgi:hypothetical protein
MESLGSPVESVTSSEKKRNKKKSVIKDVGFRSPFKNLRGYLLRNRDGNVCAIIGCDQKSFDLSYTYAGEHVHTHLEQTPMGKYVLTKKRKRDDNNVKNKSPQRRKSSPRRRL